MAEANVHMQTIRLIIIVCTKKLIISFIGCAMFLSYLITALEITALLVQGKLTKPHINDLGKIGQTYPCIVNCSCINDHSTGYVSANCSHKHFLAVPATFPQKLAYLDLSYNKISEISGRPFSCLVDLQTLVLSHNSITGLENGSFIGLANLTHMYLNENMILLTNESYPPLSFDGLRQLRVLHLETNRIAVHPPYNLLYPDKALSLLVQLTELHMNGIPFSYFGRGFLNLHTLSKLSLSGDQGVCSIQRLQSDAFENLKECNLTYLDLTSCKINDIDRTTFSHLKRIDTLDLTHNDYLGFRNMSESIYGLLNTSIKTLRLTRIQSGYKVDAKNEYFKYFINLTLTNLYLDYNDIIHFDPSFADCLPKSLEFLTIARNNILDGHFVKDLYKLRNLRIANGSYQNQDTQTKQVLLTKSNFSGCDLTNLSANILCYFDRIMKYKVDTPIIHIPAKLEYIYYRASKLHILLVPCSFSQNIVKHIDFSGNLIQALIGPFKGINHLKYLDLSDNSASYISTSFFTNMSSIETLLLGKNQLAAYLQNDEDGQIFRDLSNLKLLNLNMNGIKYVPKHIFKNQAKLEKLFLDDNSIHDIDIKIDHMMNLEYLDVSQNLIITIDRGMRQVMDTLARKNKLSLNLQNNVLECSCSNIPFLQWIDSTPVLLIHKEDYQCKLANNSLIPLGNNLQHAIHSLQLQCIAPTVLIIGSILLFIIISIIVMAAVIRHNKIQMGYYLYRFLDRINLFQTVQETESIQRREYKVFLSFHNNLSTFIKNTILPELEGNDRLSVCIRQRDILPGTLSFGGIYRVVHHSMKTLAFITTDYIQDEESMTELNIAFIDSVHSGRVKLIPVFMEDIVFDETNRRTTKILTSLRGISYKNYANDNALLEALVQEITERY